MTTLEGGRPADDSKLLGQRTLARQEPEALSAHPSWRGAEGRTGISRHFAARTGQTDRHFLLCFQRDAERNGKRSLSPELVMMMEAALGVDAAPLLAMQNEYDMLMAERDASFMEKLKQIRRIAAIF